MRGYPIIFGEGVDPDAYQYFLRAGIASGTQTPSSYDNAASFNGTNQFLSVADNASINLSGTSFTICAWVNPISTGSGLKTIVAKWGSYALSVGEFNSVFFDFVDGSGTQRLQNLYAYGATANRWNFLCVSVDAGAISFSVNGINIASQGGVVQGPTTFSGALVNTTNPLTINGFSSVGAPYAGAIGPCAIWKRALSPSEVSQLWNSGAGRTYASLDTGLRTNLVSWWALNQNSVTADSHGTNTLTNNGTPLVTAPNIGPIVTTTQNSRQLINNFVKGIKSLGLWNSMVCWPLRSSQNASTTQTAFSLGGGGTFNAALIGNPAWTSTGIAGAGWPAAGGQYVSTTYAMPASPVSYYAAIMPTPTSIGTNTIYYSTSGINVSGRQFVLQSSGVQNIDWMYGYNGNWPPSSQSFGITRAPSNYNVYESSKFASWRIQDSSTVFVSLNNSQTSGAITGWDSSSPAGVLNIVAMSRAPVAFSCIFNTFVSNSLDSQISALYKQTLGLGLLLP
jgi:hypothetical protein